MVQTQALYFEALKNILHVDGHPSLEVREIWGQPLVLERESETLIIDAKFKGHWEELQRGRWGELDDALREHRRADLLQVLAYSTVIGKGHNHHREEEFLKFMNLVDRQLPNETQIHVVMDNLELATHKTPRVRNWFARRPRDVSHFTPTGSSWINQVERWLAKITTEAIRRGSFRSVKHLVEAIEAYIVEHNNEPKLNNFVGPPPPTAFSRKSPLRSNNVINLSFVTLATS
jgi:transposase